MPGLRFYRRKWQFGADDVTIPSFLCSLSRLTWLILLAVFCAAVTRAGMSCSLHVHYYTSIALGIFSLTFLVYFTMLIVSCRGTILEVEKRWCMPGLFRFLTLCIILEIALAIHGTYLAITGGDPCEEEASIPYNALHAVVIGSWIDIFFATCCGLFAFSLSTADEPEKAPALRRRMSNMPASGARCCYFWGNDSTDAKEPLITTRSQASSQGGRSSQGEGREEDDYYDFNSDTERETDSHFGSTMVESAFRYDVDPEVHIEKDADEFERSAQTWTRRLRTLFACLQCLTCGSLGTPWASGSSDAFQQVAVVLAGWFKNLELVPSDILAALFLMRAEQRQMEENAVQAILKEHQDSSDNIRPKRRAFTHVGRWMWSTRGPNERATLRLHAQRIRESRYALRPRDDSSASENGARENLSSLDPEAREILLFASDMAPYMLGMYGWLLYSYMQGIRGWITLFLTSMRRCCCRRCRARQHASVSSEDQQELLVSQFLSPSSDVAGRPIPRRLFVLDDGCCSFNSTALVERVGRRSAAKADVVYASFATFEGRAVPYSVCVDRAKRRVVVAVRGLFSVADALTHCMMVPAPLAPHAAQWGFSDEIEPDSHCHAGILSVAAWMRYDLQRQDILHRLFGLSAREDDDMEEDHEVRSRAFSVDTSHLPECRGYDLCITGHSLGGGIAIVLSLFLRPVFPNVRCMAFSPPGGIFDWNLSNKCSSWVSCVFIGKDFAPRLSWHALFKLRAQVLDTLRRDKIAKFNAIMASLAGRSVDKLLYKADQVPDTDYARDIARKIDELANHRPTALDAVRLYLPGKIIHLMKDETFRRNCCSTEFHYVPMWIDDRSTLDEMLLSTRMAFDHFPDVVDRVLQGVVREYC